MDTQKIAELDKELIRCARSINVLATLTWPDVYCAHFLETWRRKNPQLPKIQYPGIQNLKNLCDALDAICAKCDTGHPLEKHLYLTADSYRTAAELLNHIGKPKFSELSADLYGNPKDRILNTRLTHLEVAERIIQHNKNSIDALRLEEDQSQMIEPEVVADKLRAKLGPFFSGVSIEIVVDPMLSSLAAASANRIRLRGSGKFSQVNVRQLLHHEGFVHMLTAINGREQPLLASLQLGSPRTTRTQEGLATFAELITNSMDLRRLERIALRVPAIQMGLDGADFIEVFQFFLNAGQSERESFYSAARIFRGGDTRGTIVFTKDALYMRGLVSVHTFLIRAVNENRLHLLRHLFAGRFSVGDVLELEPFFENGTLKEPRFVPPWLSETQTLAAYLCYSAIQADVPTDEITFADFLARDRTIRLPKRTHPHKILS